MSGVKVIDVRYREPGCTSHPVILLNDFMKNLKEPKALIRFNTEDIPIKALELLIERYGYRISAKREELGYTEVLISKM